MDFHRCEFLTSARMNVWKYGKQGSYFWVGETLFRETPSERCLFVSSSPIKRCLGRRLGFGRSILLHSGQGKGLRSDRKEIVNG